MKFYDCRTAPSPRRVRIFIAEKGIEIETIEVDLASKEQLSSEFKKINPNCTVPVLLLDDGTRYTSTAGIRNYLEALHPTPNLMGKNAMEKGMVADTQWRIEMEGLVAMAEALRNSAPRMSGRALTGPFDYQQIPALAERGKLRVERFLNGVDSLIGNKAYAAGDFFSIADIDLLVVIDFAKWIKLELPKDASNAQRWYEDVSSRESCKL
jgi:glutathione S-transferase